MVQPCVPVARRMTLSSSSRGQGEVGLRCAEDGREQIYPKATARFCFLTMSVSYDSSVSYLSYQFERNGIIWCAWKIFAQRNKFFPLRGKVEPSEEPLLLPRRIGLILDSYEVVTLLCYACHNR